MAWRSIQNPVLLANIGETVILPTTLFAVDVQPDGTTSGFYDVTVGRWKDSNGQQVTQAKTDKEAELMYYGEVEGYAGTVYCSVVVGDIEENPNSRFPIDIEIMKDEDIPDEFGVPKQEVRTADMPSISDYQYLKSKKNRTTYESAQLQKLTELMASKIIMAKDINHIRASVTNTQLFCLSLKKRFDKCVTDGENIGNGEGELYSGLADNNNSFGKKMQFRTISAGENIEVSTSGDKVEITAIIPPPTETEPTTDFCALDPIKARSYQTCSMFCKQDGEGGGGAYYRWGDSKYLGIKAQKVGTQGTAYSMMYIFGQGDGESQGMRNAGRIIKGKMDFVIEMKVNDNKYAGLHIVGNRENGETEGKVITYSNDNRSRVALAIQNERIDVDSNGTPLSSLSYDKGDMEVYGRDCACGE